jgi:hypothetical protein
VLASPPTQVVKLLKIIFRAEVDDEELLATAPPSPPVELQFIKTQPAFEKVRKMRKIK